MAIKKKNRTGWYVATFITAALIAGCYFLVQYIKQLRALDRAEAASYAAFGIAMPANYTIHGIDVSNHQNIIHWPSVQAMKVNNITMGFAFIKATEGLKEEDRSFAKNWRTATGLGLPHGAYHYFLATKNGAKQAKNFIKNVTLLPGDLPPVVDVEELYGVAPIIMQQRVQQCLDSLEKHYRTKPILYTNVDFYEHYLGKGFDAYPLWVAHYNEPEKPRIKRNWCFWQHSQEGHVNGITTFVDCNVFNGDSAAFRNMLLKK